MERTKSVELYEAGVIGITTGYGILVEDAFLAEVMRVVHSHPHFQDKIIFPAQERQGYFQCILFIKEGVRPTLVQLLKDGGYQVDQWKR